MLVAMVVGVVVLDTIMAVLVVADCRWRRRWSAAAVAAHGGSDGGNCGGNQAAAAPAVASARRYDMMCLLHAVAPLRDASATRWRHSVPSLLQLRTC